jgi:phenylacetic acid degradation operon negative regulatory protein
MVKTSATINNWVKKALTEETPRSKSLIFTIFGDSIAPYVSGIWLSELIELLRPFQVNERLVRTSSFRLTEEGWLEGRREGRKSRYSLTASGKHRVEHAYRRIYNPPPEVWDGNWTIVILSKPGNSVVERTELKRELEWEGFGLLSLGIFVHPCPEAATLSEILKRLNLTQSVVVLKARDLGTVDSRSVTTLVDECWNLVEVAARYTEFFRRFQSAPRLLTGDVDAQTAFVVQTLIIHSFRRLVLHDPRLPAALLPDDWSGHAAYNLCRDIYQLTAGRVQQYLSQHLEGVDSLAPVATAEFYSRFGGLDSVEPPSRGRE